MKKYILLFISALAILSACSQSQIADFSYKIHSIEKNNNIYSIDLSLQRPDLYLNEPATMLTTSVFSQSSTVYNPLALEYLKLEDTDLESFACDLNIFPHHCVLGSLSQYDVNAKFSDTDELTKKLDLKSYLYTSISAFDLENLEILEPQDDSDDKSELVFTTNGADSYEFILKFCYSDTDCRELSYEINIVNSELEIIPQEEDSFYILAELLADKIHLDLEFKPESFKNVSYRVLSKKGPVKLGGVLYFSSVSAEKSFIFE